MVKAEISIIEESSLYMFETNGRCFQRGRIGVCSYEGGLAVLLRSLRTGTVSDFDDMKG